MRSNGWRFSLVICPWYNPGRVEPLNLCRMWVRVLPRMLCLLSQVILRGPWLVGNGVISRVTMVISIVKIHITMVVGRMHMTPFITSPGPPSRA